MTQRRIVLIRHAKAEAHSAADFERELAPRGLRDATAIGEWLRSQGIVPDAVIISPAQRTRQTWAQAAAGLEAWPAPTYDQRIYDNSVEDLLAMIAEAPVDATTLVVVGHNPSMHGLAYTLDDGTETDLQERLARDFPTSAIAILDVDIPWADLGEGTGWLVAVHVARG